MPRVRFAEGAGRDGTGDNLARARAALSDLRAALRYLPRKRASWKTRVMMASGLTGNHIDDVWTVVEEHHAQLAASGELSGLRAEQQRAWMWSLIGERLERSFRSDATVAATLAATEADVLAGRVTPTAAADALLAAFARARKG